MDVSSSAVSSRAAPGRSCVACRKRKIRCDRQQPCSYCTKLKISCTYPAGDQEEKRQPAADIFSKLKSIELSLSRLEARISNDAELPIPGRQSLSVRQTSEGAKELQPPNAQTDRLTQDEVDASYANNSFWADLDEDDDKIEGGELDGSTAVASSAPSNVRRESFHHQAFIFSMSSVASNLQQLHPLQSQIFALWQMFMDNVDPLVKIVHIPTTQRQILRASQNLDTVPPAIEGLMFSIYFAAAASIHCDSSYQQILGEDRQILLNRYRFGVEQALAKASFMSNPSIATLQSLVLYLICARSSADKPYVWTMTGLAIRLATKLGLHEDPVARGLPPYISEVRRRLWWQICILDVRTAEDNDMDPYICEHHFDTKFPSNVNDADLDINMTEPVRETGQRTEMLFSLTRIEISYAARQLAFSAKFVRNNGYKAMSQHEENDYIDHLHKKIQDKYLGSCDLKIPICFLAATATRMVLTKMKLTINRPSRAANVPAGLPRGQDINLIENSIEIIEYAHSLRSDEKYNRWVWLFQKYVEWDAMAFLLCSLIVASVPHLAERAWTAVNTFFQDWSGNIVAGERRWKRLEKLRAKAMAKRNPSQLVSDKTNSNDPIQLRSDAPHNDTGASNYLQTEHLSSGSPHTAHFDNNSTMLGASAAQADFDWYFDDTSDAMQGIANWESDIDANAFASWL